MDGRSRYRAQGFKKTYKNVRAHNTESAQWRDCDILLYFVIIITPPDADTLNLYILLAPRNRQPVRSSGATKLQL